MYETLMHSIRNPARGAILRESGELLLWTRSTSVSPSLRSAGCGHSGHDVDAFGFQSGLHVSKPSVV
ncbi:hypothetical protein TNCV_1446051 [Trichonephila clavipes]|nr:hypothetical protein TNCV_1446051 [Trichonephila clavipes]